MSPRPRLECRRANAHAHPSTIARRRWWEDISPVQLDAAADEQIAHLDRRALRHLRDAVLGFPDWMGLERSTGSVPRPLPSSPRSPSPGEGATGAKCPERPSSAYTWGTSPPRLARRVRTPQGTTTNTGSSSSSGGSTCSSSEPRTPLAPLRTQTPPPPRSPRRRGSLGALQTRTNCATSPLVSRETGICSRWTPDSSPPPLILPRNLVEHARRHRPGQPEDKLFFSTTTSSSVF